MRKFGDQWIHSVQGCTSCVLGKPYNEIIESRIAVMSRHGLAAQRAVGHGALESKIMVLASNELTSFNPFQLERLAGELNLGFPYYLTYAVKCGLSYKLRDRRTAMACIHHHLDFELEALHPWVIWSFGNMAALSYDMLFDYKPKVKPGDYFEVETPPWWSFDKVKVLHSGASVLEGSALAADAEDLMIEELLKIKGWMSELRASGRLVEVEDD